MDHHENCESCLMPFSKDHGKREDPRYCSLCYGDGKFRFEGSLRDFQRVCFDGMRKQGMPWLMAKVFSWSVRFAPRWKGKA